MIEWRYDDDVRDRRTAAASAAAAYRMRDQNCFRENRRANETIFVVHKYALWMLICGVFLLLLLFLGWFLFL